MNLNNIQKYIDIQQEIYEIENDNSLSTEEKKTTLAILKTEFTRISYDSNIADIRNQLGELRNDAIPLATPYLKFDDEKKLIFLKMQ